MHSVALTHRGLKRPSNQDRYLLLDLPEGRVLAAVADGMGGMAGGEVAAQMAVDRLVQSLPPVPRDHLALGALFARICNQVYQRARVQPELEGMGTTLTAALVGPRRVDWAHVGDSRLYRWQGGRLEQVTRDHTATAFMVEEGMLSREEARRHPARHLLFDCLGCGDCTPDSGWFRPGPGELLLLTTDGLHDKVPSVEMRRVLVSGQDLSDRLNQLLALALEAGGSDNITVVGLDLS